MQKLFSWQFIKYETDKIMGTLGQSYVLLTVISNAGGLGNFIINGH